MEDELFVPVEIVKNSSMEDLRNFLDCPIEKIRFLRAEKYKKLIKEADYYDLENYLPRDVLTRPVPNKDLILVLRSYQNNFRYTLTIRNKYFDADSMTNELREKMIHYILKYIKILYNVDVIDNAKIVIKKYKEKEGNLFAEISSFTIAEILKEIATVYDCYYDSQTGEIEEYKRYLFYPKPINKRNAFCSNFCYDYCYDYCIEGHRFKILFDKYNVLVYFIKSKYVKP